MKKLVLATAALSLLATAPVAAQTVRDKKSCMRAVEDAKGMREDSAVTGKFLAQADDLVRIAEHLCGEGNFVYAETLLQLARGMLANE